jgi:hypothetical protein
MRHFPPVPVLNIIRRRKASPASRHMMCRARNGKLVTSGKNTSNHHLFVDPILSEHMANSALSATRNARVNCVAASDPQLPNFRLRTETLYPRQCVAEGTRTRQRYPRTPDPPAPSSAISKAEEV